jgi:hypothetical protein
MPCNTTVSGRGPDPRARKITTPGASSLSRKSTLASCARASLTAATLASCARAPLAKTNKQTAAPAQNQRTRDRSIASLLGRSRTWKRHASQPPFTHVVNSSRDHVASETHRAGLEECDGTRDVRRAHPGKQARKGGSARASWLMPPVVHDTSRPACSLRCARRAPPSVGLRPPREAQHEGYASRLVGRAR